MALFLVVTDQSIRSMDQSNQSFQFEAQFSGRQIGILASTSKQPKMGSRASATAPASDVQQMHLWALSPREMTQLEPWLW